MEGGGEARRPVSNVPHKVWLQFEQYTGPIPHPAILEHYERVLPGSADRIFGQFEEQGRHRRKLESRVVTHNMFSATLGQVGALILFLAAIGGGVFLLFNDKTVEGLGSIIAAVGGAAWVLRKAETRRRAELAKKRDDHPKR